MTLPLPAPRGSRFIDPRVVAVKTAPGGVNRHVHCAIVDADGNGYTSPGADGHVHEVIELEVQPARPGNHTHDLSAQRCAEDHNHRGNHVIPRPRRAA